MLEKLTQSLCTFVTSLVWQRMPLSLRGSVDFLSNIESHSLRRMGTPGPGPWWRLNPVFHDRSKHIEMKYHFIRDLMERGALKLQYIRTNEQIADILTKPLSTSKFVYFRGKLGMAENASLAEGVLIFLSSIESHSLRRMGTPGQGPQCGINLELNDDIWSLTMIWTQPCPWRTQPCVEWPFCWMVDVWSRTTMWASLVLVDPA